MKTLKSLKIAVISLLFFLIPLNASINKYVISDDVVIDARTAQKLLEIGTEVKEKTNVNIYVYARTDLGLPEDTTTKQKIEFIKKHEEEIASKLEKPFVLLTLYVEQTHVNIITSETLKTKIDKNDILNGYVVPLLASKDKNSLFAKASAAVLNGYDEIADQVALANGIEKLETGLPDSGKTAGTIWKVLMYTLVLAGIILYTLVVLKSKKRK